MTEPLVVTIPHKLGKDEALRRLKPALGKASASFPALAVEEEIWSGDSMSFRVRALGQVELIFTFASAIFIFKEKIKGLEVVGCLLIVGGILTLLAFR